MSQDFRDKLLDECRTVEENCLYNAQAHFKIAARWEGLRWVWLIAPALIVGVMSALAAVVPLINIGGVYKTIIDVVAAFAGLTIAITSFLNYDQHSSIHNRDGNVFTTLRHEARILCDTFSCSLGDEELSKKVQCLKEKYSYLIQACEPTDEESFLKAREDIHKGFHEPDHKKE